MRMRRFGIPDWRSWGLPITLYCLPFFLLSSAAQEGKRSREGEQVSEAARKPEHALQAPFETYTLKERSWWAYQKSTRPVLPTVKNPVWVKTPVDAFVLARLEK